MKHDPKSTSPGARLLTILSIWQFMAVTAGFLLTRIFLRHCDEYTLNYRLRNGPILTALTLFVRSFGLWFLLAPPLWWTFVFMRRRRARDVVSPEPKYWGGMAIAAALTVAFAVSAFYSMWMVLSPIVT